MYIQKRVYKYNSGKEEIFRCIDCIADKSKFKSHWMDENNFVVRHKRPWVLFSFEGNIEEIEERNKLAIFITADYRYFLLYVFPLGLILYGISKWSSSPDKGMLLTFIGTSACVFILLLSSMAMKILKRNFKEALNLI